MLIKSKNSSNFLNEKESENREVTASGGGSSADTTGNAGKNNEANYEISDIAKDGSLYVCRGATLKCSRGTAPCTFNVIDKYQVSIQGKAMATIEDNTIANIPGFATCKRHDLPPCTPNLTGKWKGRKKDVVIHNIPALLKRSTIKCAFGGTIKVVNPGQKLVKE